jgi:hypothetical protein
MFTITSSIPLCKTIVKVHNVGSIYNQSIFIIKVD